MDLQIFDWCLTLSIPILSHMLLRSIFVPNKSLHLLTIHILGNLVLFPQIQFRLQTQHLQGNTYRLPLLEAEAHSLMAVILIIRLILMILDTNEI